MSRDPLHVYVVGARRLLSGRRLCVTTYSPDGAPETCDVEVAGKGGRIARGRTNRFGLTRIDLPDGDEAEVTVRALTADGRRAEERAQFDRQRPDLWLETDRTLYRPGEIVRCRIASSRNGIPVLLLVWNESGEHLLSRTLLLKDGRAEIEIPYDKRFGSRLSLGITSNGKSSTASRTVIFPGVEELGVRVIPARLTYRPGDTARVDFRSSAEAALGIAIVDQSVFERAATDEAFGRTRWFDRDEDRRVNVGGITEDDLASMDPQQIDGDLQLVAEVLARLPAFFNSTEDAVAQRTAAFIAAAGKAFAPIRRSLDDHYLRTLDYPRDEMALQEVLGSSLFKLQDHWMRPYYAAFSTAEEQHVLRFCSAGPDKRERTDDDFCPMVVQRRWFGGFESVIRDALRPFLDYPATVGDFERILAEAGIRFLALRDPWGSGMRIEIGHTRDRREIRILSAGPDRSFGSADDFAVAEFPGWYFASTAAKIHAAVRSATKFPRTADEFRSVLSSADLDFGALKDPWGRAYYFESRSHEMFTDRVEIYSYAQYNRAAEERKQITPMKRTVLFAEIRSIGEDGIVNTYDDFAIAAFSRAVEEVQPTAADTERTPAPAAGIAGKGTISGVVVDPADAAIPGVEVTLNRTYLTRTDERGRYSFRGLPPGSYRLDLSSPGFRVSVIDDVPVKADHLTRVDTVLQIGAVAETVEASASVPLISTESASLSVVSAATATSTPRVREYFPETLYWQPELVTDATGRASIEVKLADSITTWRVAVIASTLDGRITETTADVRAFQPFLVDLDVPAVLTVGDEIALPVPVRNYLERAQQVNFKAVLPKALSLRQPVRQPGRIEPSSSANATLAIRADAAADGARLRVTALAGDASDAIERPVSIHPDGERRERSVNGVVEPGKLLRLDVPASAIAGSIQAEVRFFPSPVARVLASMEALLSRPYGCGEQTISSTYPNLLLLRALKEAELHSTTVEARALKYLRAGYRRLLGYQDDAGGFTYWGRGIPDVALTAYALEFLRDAKEFIEVDEERITDAASWLTRQEAREGGARAWQARALASTRSDDADRRLGELARQAQADDPYPMAVFALAALESGKPELAGPVIGRLRGMEQDEQAFWSLKANTPFHGWGRSGQVETTAMVISALARWRKAGNADAELNTLIERGALFLMANADASGAWSSGQATVRALTALLDIWARKEGEQAIPAEVLVNGVSAGRITIPGSRTIRVPAHSGGVPIRASGLHKRDLDRGAGRPRAAIADQRGMV